ncbi:methylamine utilization protein [Rubrivivax rivuli]|uniref:Methylamine utilization protein n=2 Tax=Rubrivivax rivuli TaxID=1862385 RepID=A0A437RSW7_9BURK|nr:methylamine utilization protein [Rubrivivax rivuli]
MPQQRRIHAPLLALALLAGATSRAAPVEVLALGSDGKPLPETVVFLESGEAKAAAKPGGMAEMQQIERRFVPRVLVVVPGTEVRFPNRDKVRHHVYSLSPAKTFELKLYTGTPANPVLFDKPGVAVLGCNIHDNMVGWVVVVETPHHAVAPATGLARLPDVPPGRYRLRVWHAGLPPGTPATESPLEVPAVGVRTQVKLPLTASAL